ncbi:MAG: SH3 domain-containing protein [Marivita sp.]|uniref:SH3 domain-containing protein n=1 Tax=Marivita sp. TaxID=2003365 RepID=UPI0025C39204|nr:SH3 domain-containing protein [Marivita sp.]MCI5111689.1 SH3 domain-containing protein [Marivita sp.]
MNKYILIAFAVMGFGFYELSGGADFEPGTQSLVIFAEPRPSEPAPKPRPEFVARADTGSASLTDIAPVRAVIEPVVAAAPASLDSDPTPDAATAATAATEAATVSEPEPGLPDILPDLRFVDGDRVNLRGGPGTDYAVVGKLYRNDMVEILADEGNGWLHLRDTATGDEGWIADWLVTAAN